MLADPVVEAEIRRTAKADREADEELIGLQLMHQVETAGKRVLGPLDNWPRVLVTPFGKQGRPAPSSYVDGRTAHPARSRGSTPPSDQPMVEEPLQPVLAVPWSRKEESLDLVPVQVAVRIQLLQDGQVADGRFDLVFRAVRFFAIELEDSVVTSFLVDRQSRGEIWLV